MEKISTTALDYELLERIMVPDCKYYHTIIPAGDIHNSMDPDTINGAGHIDELNKQNGFFRKLEESILDEGFRNPILVCLGWVPDHIFEKLPIDVQANIDDTFICYGTGGSRLWAAKKHNLDVPCIVSDFVGKFSNKNDLDESEIKSYFKDSIKITFGNKGGLYVKTSHVHLMGKK